MFVRSNILTNLIFNHEKEYFITIGSGVIV